MKDPFSWHQNLDYTYPHWLYDVMIYTIYSIGGMAGIYISTCVFSAILGIVLYKVNSKLTSNKVLSFVITILAMYLLNCGKSTIGNIYIICIATLCDGKIGKY